MGVSVATGASSTYGYHARDDFTYPATLERLLNERNDGRYEVINLGIPHYTTSNIVALLREEALDYEPDLVTLYSGHNDAASIREYPADTQSIVSDSQSEAKTSNRSLGKCRLNFLLRVFVVK